MTVSVCLVKLHRLLLVEDPLRLCRCPYLILNVGWLLNERSTSLQ